MRALLLAIATAAATGLVGLAASAQDARTGYAGQQSRAIKALSEEDIAALRNGDGMGFAKAAELNGYPGPRHALDLARELGLSETQMRQVKAVYERMNAAARALGAALIEREQMLDQLFANGEITPERLTADTTAIGDAQARLRAVHLIAHLETRAILSADQVARYDRLRGYAGAAASQPDRPAGGSAGHRH